MNTPAHLIFAAAAFARPDQPRRNIAVLAGALAPDISLYAMVAWAIQVQGIPARQVFSELYFSDAWMRVFAVDNSFILWGLLFALGLGLRQPLIAVFAAAALLHIALDFPLHHDDGRPHFWPLSMWIFESPLSYWDRRAHGAWVGAVETGLCAAFLVVLWRRFQGRAARGAVIATAGLLAAPGILFGLMF